MLIRHRLKKLSFIHIVAFDYLKFLLNFLNFNFREEREEKKDRKTCEEEVQKLSDGYEIRRKKLSTFNMQQNSKHVIFLKI